MRARDGEVFIIDPREADAVADLSTDEGREAAARAVEQRYPAGIDALICCAGIGNRPEKGAATTAINFFGTTRLLERLRGHLARRRSPRAVVTASMMALHPHDPDLLALMLDDDEAAARAHTNDTMASYITGKLALCHWVRRNAVRPEWAGAGILLNGIGPGLIRTPLTSLGAFDTLEAHEVATRLTPLAMANYPGPEAIAPLYEHLAGPDNQYLVGQVIFADGGSDVLLRGEAVP